MLDYLVGAVTLMLVILLAGIKGLHFHPNKLSDFELKRRIAAGDEQAAGEQRLRQDWPVHQAFQRVVVSLMTGMVTGVLLAGYGLLPGSLLVLLALVLAEALSANHWLARLSEKLVIRFRPQLCGMVDTLQPVLKPLAYRHQAVPRQTLKFYSKDELQQAIEASSDALTNDEKRAVTHALAYHTETIRQVMTPRAELLTLKPDDTLGPVLLNQLHKNGQGHFLVEDEESGRVTGILNVRDVMPLKPRVKLVRDAMSTQLAYVRQDQPLTSALDAFLQTGQYLFIVINETEETVGVMSIEDTLRHVTGRHRANGSN